MAVIFFYINEYFFQIMLVIKTLDHLSYFQASCVLNNEYSILDKFFGFDLN